MMSVESKEKQDTTCKLTTFFFYIWLNSTKKLCWQVTMLGRAKTNGMVKFKNIGIQEIKYSEGKGTRDNWDKIAKQEGF